jgi:hypothetical protein
MMLGRRILRNDILPYDDRLVEYLSGYEYDSYGASLGVGTCCLRVLSVRANRRFPYMSC